MKFYGFIFFFLFSCVSSSFAAQKVPNLDKWIYPSEIRAGLEKLTPKRNYIPISAANVTLRVPGGFYYLDIPQSRWVYETAWKNPPHTTVLGMLFSSRFNPVEPQAWGATIEYIDVGYLPRETSQNLDYGALLQTMRDRAVVDSKRRISYGFDSYKVLGWAEKPYYDEKQNRLYWALKLKFDDVPWKTINYIVLVPGREGILVYNFIGAESTLVDMKFNFKQVLAITHFDSGYRYSDYQPGDKTTSLTIGQLFTGDYFVQTGILVVLIVFFKKYWYFIFGIVIVFWAKILRKSR